MGVALAGPGVAQSVSDLGGPAEFPPASYSANQYVDSRGCVFIRAGYGGQETWVPRVTRQREVLCGYQPTGGGSSTVAAAAPSAPASQTPVTAPPITIAVAPIRPAQQTVAVRQVPAQVPVQVRVQPAAPAPVAPATTPAPVTVAVTSPNCPNLPASSGQFMRSPGERCGPQANHPGDAARGLDLGGNYTAPPGYRAAWDDGRLNPNRGLAVATAQGAAAQDQYWQDGVPLTAIDLRVVIVPNGQGVTPVTRASSTPTLITPAPAAPATVQVSPSDRYVEVARYTDRSLADRARQQLARQGMPTSLGMVSSSGTLVVLAGPFDDPQSLGRTLNRALELGYSAAVTRR